MRKSVDSLVLKILALKDKVIQTKSYPVDLKNDLRYELGRAISHLENAAEIWEEWKGKSNGEGEINV